MKITRTSPVSKMARELELDITPEEFAKYKDGDLIGKAFPRLSADEREFFKTGIWGDDEWAVLYSTLLN